MTIFTTVWTARWSINKILDLTRSIMTVVCVSHCSEGGRSVSMADSLKLDASTINVLKEA